MTEGSDRSLRMLQAALEKEQKGREFYEKAASECVNELGRDVFRVLAQEEVIHIKRVKQIYESLQGGKSWTDDWTCSCRAGAFPSSADSVAGLRAGPPLEMGPGRG